MDVPAILFLLNNTNTCNLDEETPNINAFLKVQPFQYSLLYHVYGSCDSELVCVCPILYLVSSEMYTY